MLNYNILIKLSEEETVISDLRNNIRSYTFSVMNNKIPKEFKQEFEDGNFTVYFPDSDIAISGPGEDSDEVKKNAIIRLKYILAWIIS